MTMTIIPLLIADEGNKRKSYCEDCFKAVKKSEAAEGTKKHNLFYYELRRTRPLRPHTNVGACTIVIAIPGDP